MFTKQNKIKSLHTSYVYKTQFTNALCLQNKNITNVYKTSLQTRYVYKTKNYRQVMFTKQTEVYKHVMFIKQNRKLTKKLCLQNNVYKTKYYKTENVHTSYVHKAIQIKTFTKHVMLIKNKTFSYKLCLFLKAFVSFHYLSAFHSHDCQFHVFLVVTCDNFVTFFIFD